MSRWVVRRQCPLPSGCGVDISALELTAFEDPYAAGVEGSENGVMLEVICCHDEDPDLVSKNSQSENGVSF